VDAGCREVVVLGQSRLLLLLLLVVQRRTTTSFQIPYPAVLDASVLAADDADDGADAKPSKKKEPRVARPPCPGISQEMIYASCCRRRGLSEDGCWDFQRVL
jgi:hypothetical protein